MRKPTKRRKTPGLVPKPYHLQVGRAAVRTQLHGFDTEAKCRAAAKRIIEHLRGDMQRWNPAGLEVLDALRADVDAAIFDRDHYVICRTVDEHTGQDVYLELWGTE